MKYAEQILFCVSTAGLYYFAGTNTYDDVKNRYQGLIGVLLFLLSIGMLRTYDGPYKKLQWMWRALFQCTIIYNAFLVYIAFQNEKEARYLMSLGDSRLNKPIPKDFHTYDDNCEFEWINIWDNIDHYFLTHCVNWFMVSLLLRDAWILHIWQLLDEVLELSWQHILPHFRECWWDHVILDVLMSNTVFIIVGLWVVRKSGLEQYDWFGRHKKSFFKMEFWTNHHHFGAVMAIILLVTVNFLDGFFLMNQLWLPPKSWMPVARLVFWFLIGNFGFREHWMFLQGKTVSGQMRYICVFTATIETFISIKFLKDSGNIQYVPTPEYILYPWIAVVLFSVLYYIILRITGRNKKPYTLINGVQSQHNHKLKNI